MYNILKCIADHSNLETGERKKKKRKKKEEERAQNKGFFEKKEKMFA